MPIKIAINGYGRIGRCILRALFEAKRTDEIELVAINDLSANSEIIAHLTQYDLVHGRFGANVSISSTNELVINNQKIKIFANADPKTLPWGELGIDVVLECTGIFVSKAKAITHITAGAKKVIISAPAEADVDATIVYGVNHHLITPTMEVISNASCTTNCLAPIAKILNDTIGIEHGLMTTIHSYTSDQVLLDNYHKDLHRARAASLAMIPTKTGAAKAVGLVLPELQGLLDGLAIRVPTPNVSLIDFTFTAKRTTTVAEINEIIAKNANNQFKNILQFNTIPLVSGDFNHNPHSSIFDATQTRVLGKTLVKVFSWYDNEWGFSNRMLDNALALCQV